MMIIDGSVGADVSVERWSENIKDLHNTLIVMVDNYKVGVFAHTQ